ncbi:MAG TPA: hypothetical protein VFO19_07340 [Vicinamibacterales bacterium]|nr:hypothetical protein [Vicinamibacterales bacterium]
MWLLIGFCGWEFFRRLAASNPTGVFATRVLLWPLAIAIVELMLWFAAFRSGDGDRVPAAFVAMVLLLQGVLVPLLVASIYDVDVNATRPAFFGYVAISHLLYALRRQR